MAVDETKIPDHMLEPLQDSGAMLVDHFEEALIGVGSSFGTGDCALYDLDKILEVLMTSGEGMTHEQALEHWSFNILQNFQGDPRPVFVTSWRHLPEGFPFA
jgi:hypothetical protein